MSKKVFMLIAWYIAWSVVTWLYANKKGEEVKKDIKKQQKEWGNPVKYLADYFLWIQKKFFWDVTDNVVTEENKEKIQAKVKDVVDIIDEYKIEAEKTLKKLKKSSKNYIEEAYAHLEEFSKLKTEEWEEVLKGLWKQVSTDFKKKFNAMVKKLKTNIK